MKAFSPIAIKLLGIVTFVRLSQYAKALHPMANNPSCMVADVRLVQPIKALSSMHRTEPGIVIDGKLEHKTKTWSLSCHSFHNLKALALPGKSERATLKAPR